MGGVVVVGSLGLLTALVFAVPADAAGNVDARVEKGSLILSGDDDGNRIALTEGSAPDRIQITDLIGGTINSQPGPVELEGVTRDVRIALGAGNDSLAVEDVELPGSLLIAGPLAGLALDSAEVNGDVVFRGALDSLDIVRVTVRGKLVVDLDGARAGLIDVASLRVDGSWTFAGSADELLLRGARIDGGLTVAFPETGVASFERLRLGRSFKFTGGEGQQQLAVIDSSIGGSLKASLGGGIDLIVFEDSVQIDGNLTLQTGDGEDTIQAEGARITVGGASTVALGDGNDTVSVRADNGINLFAGKLTFDGGGGDDLVAIEDTVVGGPLKLTLGAGRNIAGVTDVQAESRLKMTSSGPARMFLFGNAVGTAAKFALGDDSIVTITECALGNLAVRASAGNDELDVTGGNVERNSRLAMGNGANDVRLVGVSFGGNLAVRTGDGDDQVIVTGGTVVGKTTIDTGTGDDDVSN